MIDQMSEVPLHPSQTLRDANEQLVLAMLQATADAEKSALRLSEVTLAAHLDALTGLPDRLLFFDRFSQAIVHARRHGSQLALLFLDLDRFKQINDTLGHAIGDQVLRAAAHALRAALREADTVSRHGGDEFLVLLTEISNADDAAVIAHKLCDAIGTSREMAALGVRLTASIGVGVYPNHGDDALTLIAHADSAMYRAKKARSGVATYSSEDEWSPSGQATEFATIIDGSASQPQPQFHDGDGRYQQLREANERLVISALEAQTMQDAARLAHPYRALIDRMEDGAIAVDGDGNLLLCNRRFASLIDIDCDALVGAPFSSFFATVAEAQAFRGLLARGAIRGASENFSLLDAKGTKIPVNITVADGQAQGTTGAARMIACIVADLRGDGVHERALAALTSRLRQAVIERGRSERRLGIALEAAGMGILEVDLTSGVVVWTHRHDRIFGTARAPNQVKLIDLFKQVVPDDRAHVELAFADALTSGVIDVEHRIRRADTGAVRWIHIKAVVRHDASGRGRAAGVVADVTERHAVADQRRLA